MIIQGDALSVLKRMDSESVHCAVTSSPYWMLRSYGTEPVLWSDGWKGELGQESTPEQFIRHLTEINHEVKRVLRNDGIYWVNIGDSYAGSHGNGYKQSLQKTNGAYNSEENYDLASKNNRDDGNYKPKDLIEIPSMLAASMRADGWFLRARIPWVKRSAMPSSVRDRPGSSIEYIFLFSKTNKYFYDYVSTMQQSSESYNKDKRPRGVLRQCVNPTSKYPDGEQFKKQKVTFEDVADGIGAGITKQDLVGNPTYTGFNNRYEPNGIGLRYMRDSDFFFKTWQGLLHNEDGEPMALVVNPKGYKGSHFASFPINLVIPLILSGSSEKGVCPHCGAPWVRITKKGEFHNQSWGGEHIKGIKAVGGVGESSCLKTGGVCETITIDWKPSCSCENNIPTPATVLDPFSGSSATGVACKLYNRDYIGIELNPEYVKLGHKRIQEGK